MSSDKDDIDVDEDFTPSDSDDAEAPVEPAKTNLSKRRTIDNLLEERRLQRQLADYDFDL
ncbi:PA3496 family putative envelope integrity protein [Pseudomonas sp. NPDC007930]|uniref:PA3496 family putative envelope integrity protein n=1 Tax=Pseudomonas sp. NPDC007930 TaxID=3364417 RepID=UPI0036E5100B